jgi:hypothetical protein
MVTITNQKQSREVQGLGFCFLCGSSFCNQSEELKKTLDHLPPQAVFATSDKDFPLQVPAHWKCNHDWSKKDEIVAELIAVVHGKKKTPKKSHLEFGLASDAMTGDIIAGVGGLNIERHVIRWVRGFHAALYREFLPDQGSTNFCVSLPTPRLLSGPKAASLMQNLQRNHLTFVEVIKKNRMAERLDRIHSNNGKFTYECVWAKADDGTECCVFAIQLYDWQLLGPTNRPRTSCVGMYLPQQGRPILGTQEVAIEIPILNAEPFDAFSK